MDIAIKPAIFQQDIAAAASLYPGYAASGSLVGSPKYEFDFVARGGRIIMVAWVSGLVTGVVPILVRTTDQAKLMVPEMALLQRLRVLPAFNRQGLGRALDLTANVAAREARLKRIDSPVTADNDAAIDPNQGLVYAFVRIT